MPRYPIGNTTRLNKKLGELDSQRFKLPLIQRVIDKIAAEGTPSKAAHVLKYLRRLLQWSKNRDFIVENPARGIETITLIDANELKEGILTNWRKGSRDNIVL